MAAPTDFNDWSLRLEEHLLEGQLQDALKTLQVFAQTEGDSRVLPDLMVGAIRRLEARWGSETASSTTVTLAFATARHLIDLWRTNRAAPGLPDRRPETSAAPANRDTWPVLVGVAPGDEHTFGAQILSDDLLMRGWTVDLLLSTKAEALLKRLSQHHYGAVMLSVGHDDALAGLGNLIAEIRLISAKRGIVVVVGGSGLAQPLAQYHFLGADLVAGTAAQGAEYLASHLQGGMAVARN